MHSFSGKIIAYQLIYNYRKSIILHFELNVNMG